MTIFSHFDDKCHKVLSLLKYAIEYSHGLRKGLVREMT